VGGNELQVELWLLAAKHGFLQALDQSDEVEDGPMPGQCCAEVRGLFRGFQQHNDLPAQLEDGLIENCGIQVEQWLRTCD